MSGRIRMIEFVDKNSKVTIKIENFDIVVIKDAYLTKFDICYFCIPELPWKVKFDKITTVNELFNTLGSTFNC